MIALLKMFGISLVLTLVIELAVVRCFGLRTERQVLLVVLVNILTNPAAVLLNWLGVPQIPIEIGVVLTEYYVYQSFSKSSNWNISHPLALSIAANGISWGLGLLIQAI